jgi:hypothetical protein
MEILRTQCASLKLHFLQRSFSDLYINYGKFGCLESEHSLILRRLYSPLVFTLRIGWTAGFGRWFSVAQ